MIPPVLIRQIRSCEECIFYNTLEEFCTLHDEALFGEKIERWEIEDPSVPCPYNFTSDEVMELIEQDVEKQTRDGKTNGMWTAQ